MAIKSLKKAPMILSSNGFFILVWIARYEAETSTSFSKVKHISASNASIADATISEAENTPPPLYTYLLPVRT